MKYARRRSIVPRPAALSWGGKRWEGERRQERARGMNLSQHWERAEKWSCCAQEKRSHTRQTTLEGLKQWDQGQRVSKSPPRTESRGYPSSFQSSQSDCSLCIWTFGSGKRSLRRDQGEVMILGRMWPAVLIFTDTPCRLGALSVCKVMPLACVSQAEDPSWTVIGSLFQDWRESL